MSQTDSWKEFYRENYRQWTLWNFSLVLVCWLQWMWEWADWSRWKMPVYQDLSRKSGLTPEGIMVKLTKEPIPWMLGILTFCIIVTVLKWFFFLFYFPQFPFRSLQKTTLKLFNFKRSGARVIVVNLSLMHSTPHGESNRSKPWAQSQE